MQSEIKVYPPPPSSGRGGALATLLLLIVLIYIGICSVLYISQRFLLYFPTHDRPDINDSVLPLAVDDVLLQVTVHGRQNNEAVIYFGGNAEAVRSNLGNFLKVFANRAIYLMHYRGYDGSGGKPSEAALHRDAQALFNHVKKRHGSITLIGRSLGSGIAVRLAANNPVKRLILVTPYDSILRIAQNKYFYAPISWLLEDQYEAWRDAPSIKAPTTVIIAETDALVPAAHTYALLNAFAPNIAASVTIPGTDHSTIIHHPDYLLYLGGIR